MFKINFEHAIADWVIAYNMRNLKKSSWEI